MAYYSAFSYNCEISFNLNNKSTDILPETVKYIIIDYDYRQRVMPVIYMNMNLEPSVYNKMVPNQGKGKIYFKLYRRNVSSTSAVDQSCIYSQFDYYMTDDPNAYKKLDEQTAPAGTAYKNCTIGLIKSELTDQNKKIFEGVYKNTNTMSLIQNATSHMKMVIQPFVNNVSFDQLSCPTIGSVGQFIQYINSQYSFYNGPYTYFMDFDKTYLRSNDGMYIDAKDGLYPYIAFDIRDLTEYQAHTTGMVFDKDQKAYIIYSDGNSAKIITDRGTSQLASNVIAVTSDGQTTSATIDTSAITNISPSIDGATVIKSDDPNAAKVAASGVEENAGLLVVTKADMDTRVFTPNRQFLLSNYEDNPKYCGTYYMVYKKEIYLRVGNVLKSQMTIGLKRISGFK